MIGRELVEQLEELGCEILKFDIQRNWKKFPGHDFGDCRECGEPDKYSIDVTDKRLVEEIFKAFKPEYVFHLFGIKGNPKMTEERPVDFMGPMLQGDTNIILACQKYGVKRMLYTSSIAVENPESDKYPAWAKSTAEKLIEAMKIQYPKGTDYCIVRPANVYGRFDNLEREDNMVVTSLIKKALKEKELILDRKGSKQIRDFISAKDVARGMIKAMEEMPEEPVNLCSSVGTEINIIANIIADEFDIPLKYKDLDLTLGPRIKVMENPYIETNDIEEELKEVINYVKDKS